MPCSNPHSDRHCFHAHTGPWWGVTPPPRRCCWCGATDADEHGPYRGIPSPYGPLVPSGGPPWSITCW